MPRPKRADVQSEYSAWLAMPKRVKVAMGLPTTKTDFSEFKGVAYRTLMRWDKDPEFQELVRQQKMAVAGMAPNASVAKVGSARPFVEPTAKGFEPPLEVATAADDPVFDETLSAEEQSYLKVKDTLIRMAEDGNQSAIDLYLKHYGKMFINAETADFADYKGLSDVELAEQICGMLGVERVSGWLASRVAAEA